MAIAISNKSDIACDERAFESLLSYAFRHLSLDLHCELAISLVDIEEMSDLNRTWMEEEGPTDVLSFPMDELKLGDSGPAILGDIVLCPEYARGNAVKAGTSLDEELQLLLVHGLLHLLGLDHRESAEEVAMFALQGEILREWRSQS
ncbi:MAG: rRNA maturation RNase YbeY [Candidatus Nanopelagicaceae bacterium]|jgi:probable rRNA maturation factor